MNNQKEKFECPHCKRLIVWNSLTKHLIKCHQVNEKEAFLYSLKNTKRPTIVSRMPSVPLDILIQYIDKIWINEKPKNFYQSQFNSFYRSIIRYRNFNESDFDLFFNSILPWKLKHPGSWNARELCSMTFPDNKEFADKMYEETILIKNPYYNHDGSLSPFSKNFKGYNGLSEEEKNKKILLSTKHNIDGRNWNQVKYWTKQGYTEEEAKRLVSEKQKEYHFSLEKCIAKYGKEDGTKRWKDRQIRWQNTLNSKSKEEIERINKAKASSIRFAAAYSKISQELFWKIFNLIKNDYHNIFFATFNRENKNSNENFEYEVLLEDGIHRYFLDFYVKDNNKVIEFDGDYWHGEKRGNQQRDKEREDNLKQLGFTNILHVKECDYVNNPDKVIVECINFLKG